MPRKFDAPRDGGRARWRLFASVALAIAAVALVPRVQATATTPLIAVDTNAGASGIQSETTFPPGTSGIAVAIAVADAQPTGAFEFQLSFDPRVLQYQSWSEGAFLASTGRTTACVQTITQTTIRVGCGTSGGAPPDGPSGSGTLALLVFRPLASAHTCLNLLEAETATVAGGPIATTMASGCVTLSVPDSDGDGVSDPLDNCVAVANAQQTNSDSMPLDNGSAFGHNDATVPAADALGDACDPDNDNDGLADAAEAPLLGCGAFSGINANHPAPMYGDLTTDDDGDGNPAPPMGSDVLDQGTSADTDGDGALDGYECDHGSNPRDSHSRPPRLADDFADDDGDGLANAWERAGWGTNPDVNDSDGDGIGDCQEALDIDGNGVANFAGDTQAVAKAAMLQVGATSDDDVNKDGVVNLPGDVINHARRTLGVVLCR